MNCPGRLYRESPNEQKETPQVDGGVRKTCEAEEEYERARVQGVTSRLTRPDHGVLVRTTGLQEL